jgi:hypothetical protein
LIVKLAKENEWGSPRIHGELTKLGFAIDESTVSNYMPACPSPPSTIANWKQFLKNHNEFIYATDFFSVPFQYTRYPQRQETAAEMAHHELILVLRSLAEIFNQNETAGHFV